METAQRTKLQEEVLEAIQKVMTSGGPMPGNKAPAYAHAMLDGMLAAKSEVDRLRGLAQRGAPGWAHALLDFLWDLF
ncbi:MAG TPA: hypothetical protein ENK34_14515 [Rhodobacteraceae bacterium]|nr:hypothetical protein [Paracoccaceae bacterium]